MGPKEHTIQFLNGGKVKVDGKDKWESTWKLKNDGKILEITTGVNIHKLRYNADKRKADVINSESKESQLSIWGM